VTGQRSHSNGVTHNEGANSDVYDRLLMAQRWFRETFVATLYPSGFVDDVTFARDRPVRGDARLLKVTRQGQHGSGGGVR